MSWLHFIAFVLALTLSAGCGDEATFPDTLGQSGQALQVAPSTVLELDLLGCEDMPLRFSRPLRLKWQLASHPLDPELVVLSRGDTPVCVTAAARFNLLHHVTLLAPNPTFSQQAPAGAEDEQAPETSSTDDGLSGGDSAGGEQLGMPIRRSSSLNVQDDPIPVPRTAYLTNKSGS